MAGMIVETRNKMFKLIVGLVLLLVIEFFVLGYFIGGYVIGVMVMTFIGAIWLGNRISEPLLEAAGDNLEVALTQKSTEHPKEGFGKTLVNTRKKMNRLVIWLVLIIIAEILFLPYILMEVFGSIGLVTVIFFPVVIGTFLYGMRLQFKITDPVLEAGGDLLDPGTAKDSRDD